MDYELGLTYGNLSDSVNDSNAKQTTINELSTRVGSLENQLVALQTEVDNYRMSLTSLSDMYGAVFTLFNTSIANESALYNISVFDPTNDTFDDFISVEYAKNRTYYNVSNNNTYYTRDIRDNATAQHIKSDWLSAATSKTAVSRKIGV